jgi:hypothetical protein
MFISNITRSLPSLATKMAFDICEAPIRDNNPLSPTISLLGCAPWSVEHEPNRTGTHDWCTMWGAQRWKLETAPIPA